jgi:hypothetical protein
VTASRDGAVRAASRLGQPADLPGRGGAVRVDEAHELGVAVPERLHEHAPLPEFREVEHSDAWVLQVRANGVGGAVGAAVEGHAHARAGGQLSPVRAQRAADSVLFVVSWDHEIQAHGTSGSGTRAYECV